GSALADVGVGRLRVSLPADADLWVSKHKMPQRGATRYIRMRGLKTGHNYRVYAGGWRNGRYVTDSRVVRVTPGGLSSIRLNLSGSAGSSRSGSSSGSSRYGSSSGSGYSSGSASGAGGFSGGLGGALAFSGAGRPSVSGGPGSSGSGGVYFDKVRPGGTGPRP